MTFGAKLLAAAAVLCLLLWAGMLAAGVRPLIRADSVQVIYGEGEEFYSDAVAYQKTGNQSYLVISLPHARPEYRWWTVDLKNSTVSRSAPPHAFGPWRYLLASDRPGPMIGDTAAMGNWSLRFTSDGVSFSGNGFLCSIRRVAK